MAGMGKRMRPHTLTMPKPLLPVAGKPIVQRLVEEIVEVAGEKVEEIAFIIGNFGHEVETELGNIARKLGATPKIYYQHEALGTAHAVLCAADSLSGKVTIAFADTLFKADFKIDKEAEASIWVQKVQDPSSFGVVKLDAAGYISDFVEKPKTFVSDLAIIGIYYFRDGERLRKELQSLIDNNFTVNGEFQLTDALENMKKQGVKFSPGEVREWLDCGNKDATVHTNKRILEYHRSEKLISDKVSVVNSSIVEPCYIGDGVVIENSVVGPHASVGDNTAIRNSVVTNSIIQDGCIVDSKLVTNTMLGKNVEIKGEFSEYSLGDFSVSV